MRMKERSYRMEPIDTDNFYWVTGVLGRLKRKVLKEEGPVRRGRSKFWVCPECGASYLVGGQVIPKR